MAGATSRLRVYTFKIKRSPHFTVALSIKQNAWTPLLNVPLQVHPNPTSGCRLR